MLQQHAKHVTDSHSGLCNSTDGAHMPRAAGNHHSHEQLMEEAIDELDI